jgi:hypothetical protein
MARIARAQWRPLPQNSSAAVIRPRLIIVHTQVGSLAGTESWFRNVRAQGVESTFGIGGPWDGPDVDGDIYQWMDTHRQADCNLSANGISVSIEMADGGDPTRPFSPKQIASLTALIVDLCRVESIPPTLARAWDGWGLGYHQQFAPQWNRTHDCPGTVRRSQLLRAVFPAAYRALHPPKGPTAMPSNSEVPTSATGNPWPWAPWFRRYSPTLLALPARVKALEARDLAHDAALASVSGRVAALEHPTPPEPPTP